MFKKIKTPISAFGTICAYTIYYIANYTNLTVRVGTSGGKFGNWNCQKHNKKKSNHKRPCKILAHLMYELKPRPFYKSYNVLMVVYNCCEPLLSFLWVTEKVKLMVSPCHHKCVCQFIII